MFGLDWSNPQTQWLNFTNLALGIVTLICVAVVGYNIVVEVIMQRRRHTAMDKELNQMLSTEGHAMRVPELGWTMADGGEPVPPPVFKYPPKPEDR